MIWKIIIITVLFLVIRAIYRATGTYEVWVYTEYDSFPDKNGWSTRYMGTYMECKRYIKEGREMGTGLLGFKTRYKIKRMKL